VDLHHDPRAGRQRDARALGQAPSTPAGRPGGDPGSVAEPRGARHGDADPAETRPALTGSRLVEPLRLRDLCRLDAEKDHVVHDLRGAGHDPRRRDERVMRQAGVEQEAAVVVSRSTFRLGGVGLRQRQVERRLALTR
jgi:hypothetical protein